MRALSVLPQDGADVGNRGGLVRDKIAKRPNLFPARLTQDRDAIGFKHNRRLSGKQGRGYRNGPRAGLGQRRGTIVASISLVSDLSNSAASSQRADGRFASIGRL